MKFLFVNICWTIVDNISTTVYTLPMITPLLMQLGLNQKESRIYLHILNHGRITPAEIAKQTKINRATVYSIAKSLVTKGLITEDLGGKAVHFLPIPVDELRHIVKKEEVELREREQLLNKLISELSAIRPTIDSPIPKIRFIEEKNIDDHLKKQSPVWNKSLSERDRIWWGFQDHTFVDHYEKWIDWYWHYAPKEISLRLLSNISDTEKRMEGRHERRQIRFWDKADQFTATTWIIGDYVIMISTREHPFYLVEIHDKTMAHNMRDVFRNLWEIV
jgi:sugar-specific transcriptional regulator TrmB